MRRSRAAGDHLAEAALPFLREPVDHVGRAQDLIACLQERLPLFHREDCRDEVGALAQKRGRLTQGLGAIERRHGTPSLEAPLCRPHRALDVRVTRDRDPAHGLAARGIDDGQPASLRSWDPRPGDQ